jgi:two-component system, NarL family, response regulator NreC
LKFERKITIVVADDHTIVRRGLVTLLSSHPEMEVVGEVGNGRAAVEQAIAKEPDLVLMDVGMPELNGLEATRQLKKYSPDTKVLVLSGYDNDEYVREIVLSGANGYLLKNAAPEELLRAIIAVSKGQTFFSPSLSDVVAESRKTRSTPGSSEVSKNSGGKARLTQREREILQLIAEGKSHSQISRLLHISIRTVDTHRNNILKKLGLHDAASLVTYAIKNNIVILQK